MINIIAFLKNKKISEWLYLFGLTIMIIGLPLGNFIISIGGFVLLGSMLFHGAYKEKLADFIANKQALALTSIFLLYAIGSLYSLDTKEAIHELRIIIPLLFLPFVFAAMPAVSKKHFFVILHFFVLAVVVNSVVSYSSKIQNTQTSYRNVIHFISHIRFALMLVFSIHILGYYFLKKSNAYKLISTLLILWLIYFLSVFESATGVVTLVFTIGISAIILIYSRGNKLVKLGVGIGALGLMLLSIFYVKNSYHQYFNAEKTDLIELDKFTANGEPYMMPKNLGTLENGNYIWKYYAPVETKNTWNEISTIKHNELDGNGHQILGTLVRYITSKGYRKDRQGMLKLSPEDISNIQMGQTNHLWGSQNGMERRLSEIFYEIDRARVGYNPSDSPTVSRLLFWSAALRVIKEKPVIGWGTGSVKQTLKEAYQRTQSPLNMKSRKLVHNQYLTIALQFGVLGLIWFLYVVFSPLIHNWSGWSYLAYLFLAIFLLSCLSEDTLNTQVGLSFFAYFYGLFFIRKGSENNRFIPHPQL